MSAHSSRNWSGAPRAWARTNDLLSVVRVAGSRARARLIAPSGGEVAWAPSRRVRLRTTSLRHAARQRRGPGVAQVGGGHVDQAADAQPPAAHLAQHAERHVGGTRQLAQSVDVLAPQ